MIHRVLVLFITSLSLLAGCSAMSVGECRQACWPHPMRHYDASIGASTCGCVQEVVVSPRAPQADPTASAILAESKPAVATMASAEPPAPVASASAAPASSAAPGASAAPSASAAPASHARVHDGF